MARRLLRSYDGPIDEHRGLQGPVYLQRSNEQLTLDDDMKPFEAKAMALAHRMVFTDAPHACSKATEDDR